MTTFTSPSSFRKYDSSELSHVDISSPSKKRGNHFWESSDHEDKVWRGRTQERVIAAINDTGGHLGSVFLIGHSWCVGPGIFLVWRIMIFIYLVITLVMLSFRGAFVTAEASMGIYIAQLLASFFTVLSSTFVYMIIRKEESLEMHEQVTWPHERLQVLEEPKQPLTGICKRPPNIIINRASRIINLLALLFTQNCCAFVLFWNIVFWFKVQRAEREFSSSRTNDLLLHFYNFIPVLYEIVIGCAVFRTISYLPSTIAVIYILGRISTASFSDLNTSQQAFGSEWGSKGEWHLIGRLLEMILMYIMCCFFLSLTQRARQKLIRYL